LVQLADLELIELVKSGNDVAFEHLLSRYTPFIKRLIRNYYIRNYDRDDLYQIGILAFYHAALTFKVDHGSSFYAFALSCVRNKVISIWRKNRENIEYVTDYQDFLVVMENNTEYNNNSETLGIVSDGISFVQHYRFKRLLANREIFSKLEYNVLKDFVSGMDSHEIACAKGLRIEQVDNALFRAKLKIKRQGL